MRKNFLCFVCTQTFDMNPTHSFINEAPGQQELNTPVQTETVQTETHLFRLPLRLSLNVSFGAPWSSSAYWWSWFLQCLLCIHVVEWTDCKLLDKSVSWINVLSWAGDITRTLLSQFGLPRTVIQTSHSLYWEKPLFWMEGWRRKWDWRTANVV